MKTPTLSLLPFSLVFASLTLAGLATAAAAPISVTNTNYFNGETVGIYDALTPYGTTDDPTKYLSVDPQTLVDQSAYQGVLMGEGGAIETKEFVSFSGVTSTGVINTINIFDNPSDAGGPTGSREASAVNVYYTTATLTSAQLGDPTFYTALNSGAAYTLTFSSTTTGTADQDFGGANVNYQTLSALDIPIGTTSILLGFTKSVANGNIYGQPYDYYHGVGLTEVQAFETEAVPELSSSQMVIFGLSALALVIWRRRQAAA